MQPQNYLDSFRLIKSLHKTVNIIALCPDRCGKQLNHYMKICVNPQSKQCYAINQIKYTEIYPG